MYIKILLTIITICQIISLLKYLYLTHIGDRLLNEVLPKIQKAFDMFFPKVEPPNIEVN